MERFARNRFRANYNLPFTERRWKNYPYKLVNRDANSDVLPGVRQYRMTVFSCHLHTYAKIARKRRREFARAVLVIA